MGRVFRGGTFVLDGGDGVQMGWGEAEMLLRDSWTVVMWRDAGHLERRSGRRGSRVSRVAMLTTREAGRAMFAVLGGAVSWSWWKGAALPDPTFGKSP